MSDERLTCAALKRKVIEQLVVHIFKGPGAPLFFLWALGAGSLLVVFHMPLLALVLSAVFIGIGGFMVRDDLQDRRMRTEMLRRVIERRIDAEQLSDADLKESVRQGTGVFVELSIKTLEIVEGDGDRGDLERVLGDAAEMLTVQFESARWIDEHCRVLTLVRAAEGELTLRNENLAAVARFITEERLLVSEIGEKLETLMLQLLQMERRTSDLVKVAQLAEDATDTLRSLQAVVTTRRETAQTIRRLVASGLD